MSRVLGTPGILKLASLLAEWLHYLHQSVDTLKRLSQVLKGEKQNRKAKHLEKCTRSKQLPRDPGVFVDETNTTNRYEIGNRLISDETADPTRAAHVKSADICTDEPSSASAAEPWRQSAATLLQRLYSIRMGLLCPRIEDDSEQKQPTCRAAISSPRIGVDLFHSAASIPNPPLQFPPGIDILAPYKERNTQFTLSQRTPASLASATRYYIVTQLPLSNSECGFGVPTSSSRSTPESAAPSSRSTLLPKSDSVSSGASTHAHASTSSTLTESASARRIKQPRGREARRRARHHAATGRRVELD